MPNARNWLRSVVPLLLAALAACSGGASTQENPVVVAPPVADYTGPAPATADVQAFKVNLWENIKANNRCGGCHNATGQTPRFARNDDVNLAYLEANGVVSLTQPDQSRMVAKVGGGHNCWLSSNSACGDILTTWIRNWAGAVAAGGRTIQLLAPPIKEVGGSKTFPTTSAEYASTIWPLVKQYCARCHSAAAATPQSPYFADADPDVAYAAARPKINLDDPAKSRFVVRLRDEFHNCWSDCAQNAALMLQKVNDFVGPLPVQQVDASLLLSKALTLHDGTVASGGNRYDTNLIALYEFKTGSGTTAFDTSGVEPAANLNFSGSVEWVGGWGISIKTGGKAQAPTASSKKFTDLIKSTGEYSIEVWAAPANVAQEDAYIVSYSGGTAARNVTLAQHAYQYEAFNRSDTTDANGAPALLTSDKDRDAQASLQHVVLTYSPVGGRRLYVNGVYTGDPDPRAGGSLKDWDDSFALVLGNETSGNRQWAGVLKLVAIHNRALTLAQVQQNFAAGVGERYFLLFNVEALTNMPKSYLMFEASQYDSYSYLFTKPTFISLDPAAVPDNIPIKGLRIGVNGAEARVGQAYVPLAATVTAAGYQAATGQRLADLGTVIALEKGADADQFFLSFEQIGSRTHAAAEPAPPPPAVPLDLPPQPDIGVRTFDRLNRSMSEITGVPTSNPAVAQTFQQVKQQLPTVENLNAFLASHQTGIAQLAIKYCGALVDDAAKRQAFFPALDVGQSASAFFGASGSAGRSAVIDPLLANVVGSNLLTQPSDVQVRSELDALISKLTAGAAGTLPGRTATVAKAACAAVLGSGTLTLQ
jgi:hypothetical protein